MLCLGGGDDMLRVREIAQRCSVDRGKIYRFINQSNIKPVQIDNGVKLYDESVIKLFKQFEQSKHIDLKDIDYNSSKIKQSEHDFNLEKMKMLEEENSFLKKQLSEQNSQIKELHTLIHEANRNYLALGNFSSSVDQSKDDNSVQVKDEQCNQDEQSEQKKSVKVNKVDNDGFLKKFFKKFKGE